MTSRVKRHHKLWVTLHLGVHDLFHWQLRSSKAATVLMFCRHQALDPGPDAVDPCRLTWMISAWRCIWCSWFVCKSAAAVRSSPSLASRRRCRHSAATVGALTRACAASRACCASILPCKAQRHARVGSHDGLQHPRSLMLGDRI